MRTGATASALKLAAQPLASSTRKAAKPRRPGCPRPGSTCSKATAAKASRTGLSAFVDETRLRAPGARHRVRRIGVRGRGEERQARAPGVEQHEADALETDAFYELVAGAALDLDCDPSPKSASAKRRALGGRGAAAAASSAIAGVRQRYVEAREELERLDGPAAKVMSDVVTALEKPRAVHAYVDPFAITDLPRSLRPLAQALTVSADNAQSGLDAALSDIDCPLVALACSDIAAGALDFTSAERAAQAALDMRSELGAASDRIVRLRLRRGDLAQASEAAKSSGAPSSIALVAGIDAYEQRRADLLKQAVDDAGAGRGWSLTWLGQQQLDGVKRPTLEQVAPSWKPASPGPTCWRWTSRFEAGSSTGKEDRRHLGRREPGA